jgi:hypothetical protein
MSTSELTGTTKSATFRHVNAEELQRLRRDRGSLTVAIACLEELGRLRRNRLESPNASRGQSKFQSAA